MATPLTGPQRDRGSRANRVTVREGLSGVVANFGEGEEARIAVHFL